VANALESVLVASGKHTYVLDGDNLRFGLNSDLGFEKQDRSENVRRASEVSRLMFDAGLIVIVALVSPYEKDRNYARQLFQDGDFLEIWINTSLEICESRDVKGLYARARSNEIENFTGVSQEYEPPRSPELVLDGSLSADANAREIESLMERRM
jgi:adenylyl-sulfate kinase